MNCEIWQDNIDAFVDSELPTDTAAQFQEHLRSCPACSSETLARQRLKIETRLAGRRFAPSAELQVCLRQRFEARRARWAWLPAATGAVAVAALAIIIGMVWRQRASQQDIVSQLVDQHVQTLASSNLVDVVSTDQHTVKPWFAGKVPFSVDIPNLSGTQFQLMGGRVAYVKQTPAAQLVFGIRKHKISVFIMRDSGEVMRLANDTGPVRRAAFTTQTWTEDGLRYFVISDVNPDDMRQLCDLLKRAGGTT